MNTFLESDLNQDGFIDAAEIREQFKNDVSQESLSNYFRYVDKNQDGRIDFDEFYLSQTVLE